MKWPILFSLVALIAGTGILFPFLYRSHVKTQSAKKCVILFDLNGILVNTSYKGMKKEAIKKIGMWNLFKCSMKGDIKKRIFEVLTEEFGKQKTYEDAPCAHGEGLELPQIFCDWLAGRSGRQVIQCCQDRISTSEHIDSITEQRFIQGMVELLFDPHVLARNTEVITKGAELIAECAQNKNCTLMILSNYAADAYDELEKNNDMKNLLEYFKPEHRIISGKIGMIKPHRSIFEHVLSLYNLDPKKDCIVFIDDQEENIQAARELGIDAIQCTGNYQKLRNELCERGLI